MSRAYCDGCGRPPIVCVCHALVRVQPRTRVVVLQHPGEADNPIGTAWLVERCLGAERIVGVELEREPRFVAALAERAILLAPGPSAIDLHRDPPRDARTLIVIDGTWPQARKLLRSNPALERVPRYAFAPAAPSEYRIRREPAEHCVSTIEATVAALAILEPDPAPVQRVLDAFRAMVEHQVRIARERGDSRHLRAAIARGSKPRRAAPFPLDVVVAHAEANAWPRGTEHGPYPELAHVVAERLSTGERFEAFVAPERPLHPRFSYHTGVPAELLREERASFRTRFAEFVGARPLVVWGAYAIDLLRRESVRVDVDLRAAATRYLARRAGEIALVAEALGAVIDPPRAMGRGGARHAAAVSIARALAQSGARSVRTAAS